MAEIRKLTRLSTVLAILLAAMISIGLPLGFFYLGHQNLRAVIATEAEMNSILLSQEIGASPDYWQYEERRLIEILTRHSTRGKSEERRILTADHSLIAQSGEEIAPPRLTVAHDLFDSGDVVGQILITTSLRPLLLQTLVAALISLIIGLAIFVILKIYPLRALTAALQALYDERERALALLNNIPDIAWLKDRDDRFIAVNGPFGRLCGVDPHDLPGLTDLDIWPAELAEKYRADDREVMASGQRKETEEEVIDSTGRSSWLSTIKCPVFDDQGKIIGTSGIGRDISERKRMADELRENEEKLRTITEIAQDAIIMIDDDGEITFWNPAAEKIFGYSAEEVLGTKLHSFLAPPRYREGHETAFPRFRATGQGLAVNKTLELSALRKGGEEFPIELSLSAMQIKGHWHALGIIRDISDRKRDEIAVKERNALVTKLNSALVTLAQDNRIYGHDIDIALRTITEMSAQALTAARVSIWFYTESPVGIECIDLFDFNSGTHSAGLILTAADFPFYFKELQEEYCIVADDAVTDPRTSEFAEAYLKPLGITSMLDVPIRVSGQVIGVVCHEHIGAPRQWSVEEQSFVTAIAGFTSMVIEIHERELAEERIRSMNAELEGIVAARTRELLATQEELVRKEKLAILGQLSGSVGHELRNPLGVMSNAVYFLKMVNSDATTLEYLDIIKQEIDNSLRIISDLLDFARTKAPQTSVISVRQLLDGSLGKCVIPENVHLQIDLPEQLPALKVDPQQMGQVFVNLISNAVQAMTEDGALRITVRPSDDNFVAISIADSGTGITPENLKKLFQPLFTTKAKGIGLGLVVCRNLVEANGGRIAVESEVDQGTIFTVYLPVESAGESPSIPGLSG